MNKNLPKVFHGNEQKEHSSMSGTTCACICTGQTPRARASTGCFFKKIFIFFDKELLETVGLFFLVAVLVCLWILFWLFIMVLCVHGIDIFTGDSVRDNFLYCLSGFGLAISGISVIVIILPAFVRCIGG